MPKAFGKLTNNELFEVAQEKSATFASLTAKMTAEEFLNGGKIGGISESAMYDIKNEFFKTIVTWSLGEIRGHRVRNALEEGGVGVRFYDEYRGGKQIMFAEAQNPVDPQFLGLQDGDSLDQDEVRKPVIYDKFYVKNLNYSNWITLQPLLSKDAFNGPNGYGLYDALTVILNDLEGRYTKQAYLAEKEVINYAINNNNEHDKLQDSQIVEIEFAGDEPTSAELRKLVNTIKNTKDAMVVEDTGAFNAFGWRDIQEEGELRFITTPSVFNAIETDLLADTYHSEFNKIDIKEVKINNYGGLVPSKDGTLENRLYVKYGRNNAVVGFTEDAAGEVDYTGEVKYYNPNADVIGIICDRRFLEIDESNPYIVRVHQNDRGLYDNYFTHKIGDGIHYRSDRNFVVIKKKNSEPVEPIIAVSVNPSTVTLGADEETKIVALEVTTEFIGFDEGTTFAINVDGTTVTHVIDAEEIASNSFTENIEYECNSSDPGTKEILVTTESADIGALTTFTVTVQETEPTT